MMVPPNKLTAPQNQSADFVELFFDLVFVFAVTRVTHLTAHHLDAPTVLRSVLIFWLVWWAWTQFTWALNSANTTEAEIRLGTLISTGVAFVMASSVDHAFDATAYWFAVPYVMVRLLGLGLYLRVTWADAAERSAVVGFSLASTLGLAAVLIGAAVSPEARTWWWLGCIALDMVAAMFGGRAEGWHIRAGHFVERHGLIVIIALGESLIVAGSRVADDVRSVALMSTGALAVVVTCLMWWIYFAWTREFLEEQVAETLATQQANKSRDSFSFLHFPLICGIIGVAIGFEEILGHPSEPLHTNVAIALGAGLALYVASGAGSVWRAGRALLWPRLLILAATLGALPLTVHQKPAVALAVIASGLAVIAIVEHFKRPGRAAA